MRTQWHAGRILRALGVPLVLADGLIGLGPSASAASCQNWTDGPPPSPGTAGNVLNGVVLASACDAWAAAEAPFLLVLEARP